MNDKHPNPSPSSSGVNAGRSQPARLAAIGVAAVGMLAVRANAQDAAPAAGSASGTPATPAPPPDSVMSMPAIEVTGTASFKPHDIPQSIETVTQQEISEQAVT